MKKFFLYLSISITILFLLLLNIKKTSYYFNVFKVIDTFIPVALSSTLRMIANNKVNSKRIKNDFNEKFLPNTQYNKMDFKKIPLEFIKRSEIGYLNKIIESSQLEYAFIKC